MIKTIEDKDGTYCIGIKSKEGWRYLRNDLKSFKTKKEASIKLIEYRAGCLQSKMDKLHFKWSKLTNDGQDVKYTWGDCLA